MQWVGYILKATLCFAARNHVGSVPAFQIPGMDGFCAEKIPSTAPSCTDQDFPRLFLTKYQPGRM